MVTVIDGRRGATVPALLHGLIDAGASPAKLVAVADELDVSLPGRLDEHSPDEGPAAPVLNGDALPDADRDAVAWSESRDESSRTLRAAIAVVDDLELSSTVARETRSTLRLAARAMKVARGEQTRATIEGETTTDGSENLGDVGLGVVGTDRGLAAVAGTAVLLDDLDGTTVVTPLTLGGDERRPDAERFALCVAECADWAVRDIGDAHPLDPLGIAILGGLADGTDALPTMDVRRTGQAQVTKDSRETGMRVLVGDVVPDSSGNDGQRRQRSTGRGRTGSDRGERTVVRDGGHAEVSVLETTLHDASPAVLGTLQKQLSEAGAEDVTVIPLTAQDSRPGHMVRAVTPPGSVGTVAERLARETGALDIWESGAVRRQRAYTTTETVEVTVGDEEYPVDVTVATDDDDDEEVIDASASLDDALAVARETGLTVRTVRRQAEAAHRERVEDSDDDQSVEESE